MRTWLLAVALIFAGMACCGWGFIGLRRGSPDSEIAYTAVLLGGLSIVAVAMVMIVYKALIVLADETCLILSVDGLVFQRAGQTTRVPWDVIDAVYADGTALVVETDDPMLGEIRMAQRFTDIDAAELARRIEGTRRRALMGLFSH